MSAVDRVRLDGNREVNFGRYTDHAVAVLQCAELEAKVLGHHYIGTEHILLGIIREGEGIAAGVLESLGLTLDQTREAVEFVIGSPAAGPEAVRK